MALSMTGDSGNVALAWAEESHQVVGLTAGINAWPQYCCNFILLVYETLKFSQQVNIFILFYHTVITDSNRGNTTDR